MRKIAILIILVSLVFSACGDDKEPAKVDNVKIAVTLPIGIEIGQDMKNAAQMALDEANGKAGDIQVELVFFETTDDSGNPFSAEKEREAATKAISDSQVVVYIGASTSSEAREVIPLLNKADIAVLSPAATAPGLTKPGYGAGEPGKYYPTGRHSFFRLVTSDEGQGSTAARWAKELGYTKIYLIDDTSDYGIGLTGIFEVTARDLDLTVLAHDHFNPDNETPETYAETARHIVDAQPDLVYIGAYASYGGIELIQALRTANPDIQIMGGDGLTEQDIADASGSPLNNIYATSATLPGSGLETQAGISFVDKYQSTYSKPPNPYVITTYEAVKVALYAIEHAESPTRRGVLDKLADLGDFSGILGTWHFDDNGDIVPPRISGWQMQEGTWTFIQVF